MSDLKYQDIVEAISQIKRNQLNEAKTETAAAGGFGRVLDPKVKLTPTGSGKGPTAAVAGGALAGGLGAAASEELEKRAIARKQAMAGKGIQEEAPLIDPQIARQAKTPGYVKVPGGFDAPVGPSAEGIYNLGEPLSINPEYVDRVNRANSYRNEKLGLDGRPNVSTKVKNFVKPGGPLAPKGYSGILARMAAEREARERNQ